MIIEQIYTECLSQGSYYIENQGEAAIIDPLRETAPYIEKATKNNSQIKYVFETHFHADFVSGHISLAKETGATIVYGPKAETGFDALIAKDQQEFKIGDITLTVLHTPGHTPGSQCFKINENLISGDTLFIQGCGRVDLPGSNSDDMYHSLKKLGDLPDETILYPGHHYSPEEFQSMGKTKENNMYLKISDIETWRQIMG